MGLRNAEIESCCMQQMVFKTAWCESRSNFPLKTFVQQWH